MGVSSRFLLFVFSLISLSLPYIALLIFGFYLEKNGYEPMTWEAGDLFTVMGFQLLFFVGMIYFYLKKEFKKIESVKESSKTVGKLKSLVEQKIDEIEKLKSKVGELEESKEEAVLMYEEAKRERTKVEEKIIEIEKEEKKSEREQVKERIIYKEPKEVIKEVEKEVIKKVEVEVVRPIEKMPISVSLIASLHLERLIRNFEDRFNREGYNQNSVRNLIHNIDEANHSVINKLEYMYNKFNEENNNKRIEL